MGMWPITATHSIGGCSSFYRMVLQRGRMLQDRGASILNGSLTPIQVSVLGRPEHTTHTWLLNNHFHGWKYFEL